MKIRMVLLLLSLSTYFLGNAQNNRNVKGSIQDAESKEPIIGALIYLGSAENKKPIGESGLDGSFNLKNLPTGKLKLKIIYIGYDKQEVEIENDAEVISPISLSKEKSKLDNVIVKGLGLKHGDSYAFQLDRFSPNLQNSVSARAIEISPDLSVANVAQRVSGVSMERSSNGEGQYVILRGMDKRYSYTLINGVKIPSPDNKNRYVPLDIFPSDMLERLEIVKSLTPNLEGDAIGGMVNMVMKDAPSKFEINGNAAFGATNATFNRNTFTQYDNSASLNKSPRYTNGSNYIATMNDFPKNAFTYNTKGNPIPTLFGLSAGGRLFKNKLGVLVAGSYQNNYKNVNGVFFPTETDATGKTQIDDIRVRKYSINQQRTGVHVRLDYKINDKNSINFYSGWMNLVRNEYRSQIDTNLVLGRSYNGVATPGIGRINIDYRGMHDVQTIWNNTLSGKHDLGKGFDIDWIASYSKASDNRPDMATLSLTTGVTVNPDNQQLVYSPLQMGSSSDRTWLYNNDRDKSGYLNFHYHKQIGEITSTWSIGGMYRNKERTSTYDDYELSPEHGNDTYDGDISNNNFTVYNASGSASNALNYKATENVGAGYAMTNLNWGRFDLVGGLRYENTHLSWNTNISDQLYGKLGDKKYYDFLPSASLNFGIDKIQSIKAAYFSGISRPNFYEVIPHEGYTDPDADYPERGNPDLVATTSNNYDIQYGIYPRGLDHFLFGAFYKRIKNPIEYGLNTYVTSIYYMASNSTYKPANNKGFEFDGVKYWKWFGIKANYTYTDSKIVRQKRDRTKSGQSADPYTYESGPLQGQSKHIANVSLLVKDDAKTGINAQLAFNYTGKRINTVSAFLGNDIWQSGFTQMDFSLEKKISRHWVVYGKINNLLNTPYKLYIPQEYTAAADAVAAAPYQKVGSDVLVRKEKYGMFGLVGVRFKL